jgi:uncharacterized membrane protein
MYQYKDLRPQVFTEEGQLVFLKVRDQAHKMLAATGAFQQHYAVRFVGGDSWLQIACVDRLVELGEIREVTPAGVAGQDRVFVSARQS